MRFSFLYLLSAVTLYIQSCRTLIDIAFVTNAEGVSTEAMWSGEISGCHTVAASCHRHPLIFCTPTNPMFRPTVQRDEFVFYLEWFNTNGRLEPVTTFSFNLLIRAPPCLNKVHHHILVLGNGYEQMTPFTDYFQLPRTTKVKLLVFIL